MAEVRVRIDWDNDGYQNAHSDVTEYLAGESIHVSRGVNTFTANRFQLATSSFQCRLIDPGTGILSTLKADSPLRGKGYTNKKIDLAARAASSDPWSFLFTGRIENYQLVDTPDLLTVPITCLGVFRELFEGLPLRNTIHALNDQASVGPSVRKIAAAVGIPNADVDILTNDFVLRTYADYTRDDALYQLNSIVTNTGGFVWETPDGKVKYRRLSRRPITHTGYYSDLPILLQAGTALPYSELSFVEVSDSVKNFFSSSTPRRGTSTVTLTSTNLNRGFTIPFGSFVNAGETRRMQIPFNGRVVSGEDRLDPGGSITDSDSSYEFLTLDSVRTGYQVHMSANHRDFTITYHNINARGLIDGNALDITVVNNGTSRVSVRAVTGEFRVTYLDKSEAPDFRENANDMSVAEIGKRPFPTIPMVGGNIINIYSDFERLLRRPAEFFKLTVLPDSLAEERAALGRDLFERIRIYDTRLGIINEDAFLDAIDYEIDPNGYITQTLWLARRI